MADSSQILSGEAGTQQVGNLLQSLRMASDLRRTPRLVDNHAAVATFCFQAWRRAEAFDLTGPAAVGYADIATAIGGVVGRSIRYRSLSDDEARAELSAAGLAPEAIEARLGFAALARRGLLAAVTADVSRVLGRVPTGLGRFVADHASSWSPEPR